ncbi:MAG: ATP synthase F1 subunit delta [Firmicutes bacterium]|nr:ATP synthase F1 subunit delta [Bacillota bacterium]
MTKYAKTYAGALYDLASEEHLEDEILKDLGLVCSCLREMPEYRKLLMTPAVSKDERKSLIAEAWQGNVNKYTLNFLYMLCDGESVSELLNCEEEFRNRYNADKGIVEVLVTSAVALSEQQRKNLKAAVEKKIGKTALLKEKVDPSLIGGLKIQVAGREYDNTIAYHLGSIAQLLKN